ncbi:hypothetical protein E2562_025328 [Oryza meyeriana var. granulata]|uniref:DUF834 domain-containing protein n=1 Tax=Oryza meyeriana var. granulata TaxID=110450 RepID=A0A6G1EPB6_9ORYZ|nr:hypothetical protein E2562_025328 [Oryza meyeriana var. granulata]
MTTADWSRCTGWRPRVHKERQSPAGFDHKKTAAGVEGNAVKPVKEVAWLGSDQNNGKWQPEARKSGGGGI